MTYADKLKDPRWQKKRLEILSRDGFSCKDCYNDKKTLHVHHLNYIYGKEPWDYPNEYFTTLCEDCHSQITTYRKIAEEEIIESFRLKIKTTFHINCVNQVFEKFDDLDGLFYMLWEMLDRQDDVNESLRHTLFPNPITL